MSASRLYTQGSDVKSGLQLLAKANSSSSGGRLGQRTSDTPLNVALKPVLEVLKRVAAS